MMDSPNFAPRLEHFFNQRLIAQRQVSPHTIASYRDTFRLFLQFARQQLGKAPSDLTFSDMDITLIEAFLDDLEQRRGSSARSRNLRLTALRSFFRYAAYFETEHVGRIQQILSIPAKRYDRRLVGFLMRPEVDALLAAPDTQTWIGRRDYALLLIAFQTGLRLSEITGLCGVDVILNTGKHIRCVGKGRKERSIPLTRCAVNVLKAWVKELKPGDSGLLFPTARGNRMSADTVQYLFAKYAKVARQTCPSLKNKRLSPHIARHTAAMELLQAGVDLSVIALWLGHESINTTHIYLNAHLALKEAALKKVKPLNGHTDTARFHAEDPLLQFLRSF